MASMFQVKLSKSWQNYEKMEDKLLKRAFLAGFAHARYCFRKQEYEVDFRNMIQKNLRTGKSRQIRPPYKMQAPKAPVTKPGPTTCVKVPKGAAGTAIFVPHPKAKGQVIKVEVPAAAKAGQPLLVPVPEVPEAAAPAAPPASAEPKAEKKMGTAAKVCLGAGGLAAVGGAAVAGAILGEHIAEEGWDATLEEIGDGFEAAGEAIVDGAEAAGEWIEGAAEDAGEWIEGAAEDAGDWVMDLF